MTSIGARAAAAFAKVQYKAMDKMRHRGAFDAAHLSPTASDFAEFEKARQCVLVTYKRSGDPVPSPINHGIADGKLYVRTDGATAKVKRIRNDPRVLLVPCGLRGKPKGHAVAATARILPGDETARADAAITANWSGPMSVLERTLTWGSGRFDIPMRYIEFTPAGPGD